MSSGLDFTTLARVKALLEETGSSQDSFLEQLIAAVSARIEDEMQRTALREERTELYTLNEGSHLVVLKGAPVDLAEDFVVKLNGTPDFTGITAQVVNQGYTIEPETGMLRFLGTFTAPRRTGSRLPAGPIFVEVVYSGGLAEDTAEIVSDYPDIAQATDLQVRYIHQRRLSPGGSVTVGSGSAMYEKQYGLLDEAWAVVRRYRRVNGS